MPEQSAKSHTKWDPLFHFIVSPILLVNFVLAVKHAWAYPAYTTVMAVVMAFALFAIHFRTRTGALKVQDRVIRLEERLRLQGQLPTEKIAQITESQFVALRFASDAEVAGLAEKAIAGKWSQKQIKAAIQVWRPDHFRV
jgi:hypothetical protein